MLRFLFLVLIMSAFSFDSVLAEEELTRDNLNRKLSEISDALDDVEKRHFNMLYSNYMTIGTVESVRGSISKAIDACGENNPDMKEDLVARFGAWTAVVDPIIGEARGNVENMVLAQDYASQEELGAVLEQIDGTRNHTNSQIKKIPVTTPEACTYLLHKMDGTQETMSGLLRQTLMSLPQAYSNPMEDRAGE